MFVSTMVPIILDFNLKRIHPLFKIILNSAISSVGRLNERINYAGRTDAGVHATRQIFDFSSQDHRETSQWLKALNSHLPNDIAVSSIKKHQMTFIQGLML